MSAPFDNLPQILAALEQLQAENATLRQSLLELQSATSSVTLATTRNPPPPSQEPYYKPKVTLPNKFDGTCARVHDFLNQTRLIIRLQPRRYATWIHKVGLLGSLLTGPMEAWFPPLVEMASPLLEDFPAFLTEFESTFGRQTDGGLRSLRSIPYNKVIAQPPPTPPNFTNLPAL